MDEFVPRFLRTQVLNAPVADLENLIWLGPFRDFNRNFPIDRRDIDGAPEGAINERKRDIEMDIVPVTPEIGMRIDDDFNIEVTVRSSVDAAPALSGKPDLLAVIDAGGNVDGQILANAGIALASANGTRLLDDFPVSAAMRTGHAALHGPENRALLLGDVAPSPAIGARSQIRGRIGPGTAAMGARLVVRNGDRDFLSADGVHEGNAITGKVVLPLHRPGLGRGPLRTASEETRENVVQIDIPEPLGGETGPEGAGSACGTALLKRGMPEAIIGAALLIVAQAVVSFLHFFEFFRSIRIVGDVGMVFFGEFAIGALDFVLGRRFRDAQDFVVISFLCHGILLSLKNAHNGADGGAVMEQVSITSCR